MLFILVKQHWRQMGLTGRVFASDVYSDTDRDYHSPELTHLSSPGLIPANEQQKLYYSKLNYLTALSTVYKAH
ncbi:hypothetical protein ACT691_12670 [Vibrio metschnikovii]